MRSPTTLAILSVLAMAACAADRAQFQPTNPAGTGHGGQPAAAYDLRAGPGRSADIEVKVWSRGAYERTDHTIVRLAMELQNTGPHPVALDTQGLRLQAFDNSGRPLPDGQLVEVARPGASVNTVMAGDAATFWLAFALPRHVAPDDLRTMRLRWEVTRASGARYVQFTEFQRLPDYDDTYGYAGWSYYDPLFGYYNPYFYGAPYFGYYNVPVRRVVVDRDRPRVQIRDRGRAQQPRARPPRG